MPLITGITITAAHVDERESLWDIVGLIQGLTISDKGSTSQDFQQQLKRYADINLQTPTRQNMKDTRGKECNRWLISTRRLVETVIGQLTERFNIQKVWARDRWHLTHRIIRKILAHTIAFTSVYSDEVGQQFRTMWITLPKTTPILFYYQLSFLSVIPHQRPRHGQICALTPKLLDSSHRS